MIQNKENIPTKAESFSISESALRETVKSSIRRLLLYGDREKKRIMKESARTLSEGPLGAYDYSNGFSDYSGVDAFTNPYNDVFYDEPRSNVSANIIHANKTGYPTKVVAKGEFFRITRCYVKNEEKSRDFFTIEPAGGRRESILFTEVRTNYCPLDTGIYSFVISQEKKVYRFDSAKGKIIQRMPYRVR